MSLEQAKEVAVSIQKESFVVPPRKIDDILTILTEPGRYDTAITRKYKSDLQTPIPPSDSDKAALAAAYKTRGVAASELGYQDVALTSLRKALLYNEEAGRQDKLLLLRLARAEKIAGNLRTAIKLYNRAETIGAFGSYVALEKLYLAMGDMEKAIKYRDIGLLHYGEKIERLLKKRKTSIANKMQGNRYWVQAIYLQGVGMYADAEEILRKALKLWEKEKISAPSITHSMRLMLVANLKHQGRFVEAESEARKVLTQAIGFAGKGSLWTGAAIVKLAQVLLAQGRPDEAKRVVIAGIDILKKSGIGEKSFIHAKALSVLGDIYFVEADYQGASQQFEHMLSSTDNDLTSRKFLLNPNVILTCIKVGAYHRALELSDTAYRINSNFYGLESRRTLEVVCLRAIAKRYLSKKAEAAADFSSSLPKLLKKLNAKASFTRKTRTRILAEEYIDFLTTQENRSLLGEIGVEPLAESFRIAGALGSSSLNNAMTATSARAAVNNPLLARLVRAEQDTAAQIKIYEEALANLMSSPAEQQMPQLQKHLVEKIDSAKGAQKTIAEEIEAGFPAYNDLISTRLVTAAQLQSYLNPREALISFYTTPQYTYIWCVPAYGAVSFHKTKIGLETMTKMVEELRLALDPQNVSQFGDIPHFDTSLAYQLYSKLLKPVAASWRDAEVLTIVSHGPLGQIPFGLLPTKEPALLHDGNLLFAEYSSVEWLIKKVALSRQSSATSFISLRSVPSGTPDREPFIGFGDPVFNRQQLAASKEKNLEDRLALVSRRAPSLQRRGIRFTEKGSLDASESVSAHIGLLSRLPDTADELHSIANMLGVVGREDVYVGKAASEAVVKQLNIENHKVVMFATHALIPGDLDGLNQPALALSAPDITGEDEDGLLKMDEILKLKMNADWVVLSACNTGAGEGSGAEAVSGLGRAFFYAGARAILVSMWPIETTSARKLTTGLFKYQGGRYQVSRAEALQKSVVDLIAGPGYHVPETGQEVASYAHPFFWAPFILVGDNGLRSIRGSSQ